MPITSWYTALVTFGHVNNAGKKVDDACPRGSIKEHLRTHKIHINRGLLDDNPETLRTESCPEGLNCKKPYSSLEKSLASIGRKISTMATYPCLIVFVLPSRSMWRLALVNLYPQLLMVILQFLILWPVQSLQNNASVKFFHDGDIKGTSKKDCALRDKTCVILGKTGVSDVIVDGFVSDVNLDVTQGVASFAHLNDNAFIIVRRKRWYIVTTTVAFVEV